MNYFDYRSFRVLVLHSRLLEHQIDRERRNTKPDRSWLLKLKVLRDAAMRRISAYLSKLHHSSAEAR